VLTLAGIAGTRLADGAWVRFFDNVHWTAAYATAATLATLGWRGATAEARRARGWFALGLLAYTLGQALWDVQVLTGWNPFPGPSDAFFVLLGPGLALGILSHLMGLSRAERWAVLLDAAGLLAAVLALVLALYLPRRGGLGFVTTAVLVLYPVVLLGAAGIGLLAHLSMCWRVTPALALFALSTIGNGLLWMEWNSRTLDGTLADGVGFNYLFSIAALCQGAAAAAWDPRPSTSSAHERACFVASRSLPLLLVVAAAVAVAFAGRLPPAASTAVSLCVVVVVVLAAARQSLLLRERDELLAAEQLARASEQRSKELEAQLAHAHRLEALGTLAGGIAHDFNNILMVISGHVQLLQARGGADADTRASLGDMQAACERGRGVVKRMMAFSRRAEATSQPVEVGAVVLEAARLLRAALPSTIDLDVVVAPDVPPIHADPAQVHQVVMNLATNAAHAIGAEPGRVTIEVSVSHAVDGSAASQRHVELTVSDTGCGMDEATRRRIFEPFFTTKGPDQGTGLGLSVVHGIVTKCGGTIEVASAPGAGSRFRILIPAPDGALATRRSPRPDVDDAPRGDGREILVVDDESSIGGVLERLLCEMGWRATAVERPEAALELVRAAPRRFALVITDMTMPGMTGLELAERLRVVTPRLPIVLGSGGTDLLPRPGLLAAELAKPYDAATLARTVSACLAVATAGATPPRSGPTRASSPQAGT
jgi:signal transduction histidine kinase/CheY-like chemotaxis protein